MPLLDHFHPPLHGPRRWEGFHHAWTTTIAQQLNQDILPAGYYAEPEISLGPTLEIDVATMDLTTTDAEPSSRRVARAVWSPPRPRFAPRVDFAHLDTYEVRVFEDLGRAELRAAIELVSPANKDRPGSRRTFAARLRRLSSARHPRGDRRRRDAPVGQPASRARRGDRDQGSARGPGIDDGALRRRLSRSNSPEPAASGDLARGPGCGPGPADHAALVGSRP